MADIQLRFNKDMLVMSSPVASALAREGVDTVRDSELTLLLEPETIEELYKPQVMAGAQCLVAPTDTIVPARLRLTNMVEQAPQLVKHALDVVR